MIQKFLPFLLAKILFASLQAQDNTLIIRDVNVITLHVNTILENQDVTIQNGEIIRIQNHEPLQKFSSDEKVLNGTGKYLLPSFADAHVHLPEQDDIEHFFLMNLANGVTTMRSMRGADWHLSINKNKDFVPKIFLSSPPISRRDSFTNEQADNLMKSYKSKGYDFVKVLSVKDKENYNRLVQASINNSIKLAGHCPRNIGIFNVMDSDQFMSVEHLGGMLQLPEEISIDSTINLTIENGLYHCPTLDWYFTGQLSEDQLRNRNGAEFISTETIDVWETRIKAYLGKTTAEERQVNMNKSASNFNKRLEVLQSIYRQGGLLLLSPDATGIYSIPGYGMHTEMEHYVAAGISTYDILKAACYNLSEMMGSTESWGSIKVGSSSDLVLLNSNPLENIKNTQDIEGIIFKGTYYKQEFLLDKLK